MTVTTVFVDTRLSKTKHPRKRFQNIRQSYMLSTDRIEIHQSQPASMTKRRCEGHTSGCDWWISIRSVDNTLDWRKFCKRFRGCFAFQGAFSLRAGSLVGRVSWAKELARRMGRGKVSLHASYWFLNSPRSLTNAAIWLVKIDRLQKPVQAYYYTSREPSVGFVQGAFLKLSINPDLSFELKLEQKIARKDNLSIWPVLRYKM